MKNILFLLGVIGLCLGISGGQTVDAGINVAGSISTPNAAVSIAYFEDELAPYGQWVDVAPYGSCWSPYGVATDWRPYWDGNWAYSDYGWTWNSYEPFGWATYHYGRWVFDPYYGWVWIPDTVWGPAWVSWHYNDTWCGWAPLPPTAGWSVSVGFHWTSHDYYVPAHGWCFVENDRFYGYNPRYACAPVSRNKYLCDQTRDATHYSVRNGKPVNRGFEVKQVERWTGKRVERKDIADLRPGRGGSQFVEKQRLDRPERGRASEQRVDAAQREHRNFQSRANERQIALGKDRQIRDSQNQGRERQLTNQKMRVQKEQQLQSRERELRAKERQTQNRQIQNRGRERQLAAKRHERELQNRGRELRAEERQLQSRARERQLQSRARERQLQSRGGRELKAQERQLQGRAREREMRQERQLQSRGRERTVRPEVRQAPQRIQKERRSTPSTVVETRKKESNEEAAPESGNGKGRGRGH